MKVTTEFEQGDVVFLNSDGGLETAMTVEYVDESDVNVVWVSEYTGEVNRDCFPAVCLFSLD